MLSQEITNLVNDALKYERKKLPNFYRDFIELILDSMDSFELCRYMPSLVAQVAQKKWLVPHSYVRDNYYSSNMAERFSLNSMTRSGYFPASALQTPFHFLFRFHPEVAIDLIIKLVNHATTGYVNSMLDGNSDNIPRILIKLNDGSTIEQWGSPRLWELYRATHVGPDILESALMALESWLLNMVNAGN